MARVGDFGVANLTWVLLSVLILVMIGGTTICMDYSR